MKPQNPSTSLSATTTSAGRTRGSGGYLTCSRNTLLAIDLAVIPMELSPRLARQLQARSESERRVISWHQHGFAHANHESTERKHEFGPSRPGWLQRRDVVEGQARVRDLLGNSDPIFTPPWNRCTRQQGSVSWSLGSRRCRASPGPNPLRFQDWPRCR